jgi:hypothetical protein
MRLTKEELSIRLVVRRAGRGTAPFVWAISKGNIAEPIYTSPDTFGTMEDAYRAGQARLSEFIPTRGPRPGMAEKARWQPRQTGTPMLDRSAVDDDGHTPAGR